jgi:hypothetical protein
MDTLLSLKMKEKRGVNSMLKVMWSDTKWGAELRFEYKFLALEYLSKI